MEQKGETAILFPKTYHKLTKVYVFFQVLMVIVIFSLGLIFGYIIRRSVHEYIVAPKRCPYTVTFEVSMFAFHRTVRI